MRSFALILIAGALMACSPQPAAQTPEQTVRGQYDAAAARMARNELTNAEHVPMTQELRADFDRAVASAEARNEPFIDGDLILNCQDCAGYTNLVVTTTSPPADGHATVEARYDLDGEHRTVVWDMRETPQGWRVDNLTSPDGYDLRGAVRQQLEAAASCRAERGDAAAEELAGQCTQISPASHPPCNPDNTCALIEGEITRSCDLLDAGQRPAICANRAAK